MSTAATSTVTALLAVSGVALAACSSSAGTGGGGGAAPGGTYSTAAHTSFTMTDEVGKPLSVAQDDIHAAAKNLMFVIRTEDATGRGREQTSPKEWKVCAQSVPAGRLVDQTAYVSLTVAKRGETCPAG